MKRCLSIALTLLIFLYACPRKVSRNVFVKSKDIQKADSLFDLHPDSAFYYYNQAALAAKDSLQTALGYNGMAELQSDAGDYFGSQGNLLTSLKYLNENDTANNRCLASDYTELGKTSVNLGRYDKAIDYYNRAIPLVHTPAARALVLNNQGNAYRQQQNYPAAIRVFRRALAGEPEKGKNYTRLLTNLAYTRWLQDPAYDPLPELSAALQLRQQQSDRWGLNASYGHLSDYYFRSKPDLALVYAQNMYRTARLLKSPDDELEALQKLIRLGPNNSAKTYFLRFQQLNDSVQSARSRAKNQYALIQYETEKDKAAISGLRAANAEKKYQVTVLFALSGVLLGLALAIGLWYRQRNRRLQRDADLQMQESRLRTSRKIHDVVANGLYRIMSGLEHDQTVDKEQLLNTVEDLYERSRDISYEPETAGRPFSEQVTGLLSTFSTGSVRIAAIGNETDTWAGLSAPVQFELLHILQELLVNMKKHSRATGVGLRFLRTGERIQVDYTDNGTGMPEKLSYGNGLRSTEIRINAIRGTFKFENGPENGLMMHISFPVA